MFNVHLLLLIEAQNFGNCDYYQELTPGITYTFTSPNYNEPYAPGTFCRYTGSQFEGKSSTKQEYFFKNVIFFLNLAFAPSGYQINLRCVEVNIPYVSALE